jgi:trimeric autotransporter adhesin
VNTYEPGLSSWEIYPNPASQKLVVKSDEAVVNVDIYTLDGKRLIITKYDGGIDISILPVGIYTVKILFGTGYVGVKKFIKSH